MAFPFFLAAPFGKAAVAGVSKGVAAKGSTVGAKAASGYRGNHALVRKVAGKILDKATDEVVDSVLPKADPAISNAKHKNR
jgi:hypothetical protein